MNGKEFKSWRENAGLSMRDVQRLSGVWKSRISRFENGNGLSLQNYHALENLMKGVEPETEDKQAKIRWHVKQLEILVGSED